MKKPVVTYRHEVVSPKVNGVALIAGLTGHPRQGTPDLDGDLVARTTRVVRVEVDDTGHAFEFETENTIYRKAT